MKIRTLSLYKVRKTNNGFFPYQIFDKNNNLIDDYFNNFMTIAEANRYIINNLNNGIISYSTRLGKKIGIVKETDKYFTKAELREIRQNYNEYV